MWENSQLQCILQSAFIKYENSFLETCSFFYKTMASLSSTVGNPTKLLASSHGSCEWNSHSDKFEWDDPMFIYMKFNYTYQQYSDLAAVIMTILNWFLKHLVML